MPCCPGQADPERVIRQLLSEGLELEGHSSGGTVQVVETSAVSRLGLEDLQEAILLQVGCGGGQSTGGWEAHRQRHAALRRLVGNGRG